MRRFTLGAIALLTLLAACKVEAPGATPPRKSAAPAARPTDPSADPSAGPSAAPASARPSGIASQAPASPGLAAAATLARPAVPVKVVTGKVLVDASYLVAAGAGNILSHNGGLIVAAGAGNIISPNGGQIISPNGGQIVAAGAGNVIVNNSGNLVAAGAGNYALAQAPASPAGSAAASPDTPPPGTQLPAAGMELRARSLRDGKPLPLGVGPDGEPVYAVYSNAEGGYSVFLPDGEAGNVLLEARVPAETDVRLALDVLADTRQAASAAPASPGVEGAFGAEVNEVNAIATRYIRTCLVSRFVEVCQREDIEEVVRIWGASETAVAVVGEFVRIYRGLAQETGLDKATPADAEAVARRVLDVTLAKAELGGVTVPNGIVSGMEPVVPEPPAVAEIVDVVAHSRNQTAAKMRADPGFLATWPFVGVRLAGFKPLKPSDPADFVVGEYLVNSQVGNIDDSRKVLEWCASVDPVPGQANDQMERLNAAVVAVTMYMCSVAAYDEEVKAGCAAVFRDWKASRGPATTP